MFFEHMKMNRSSGPSSLKRGSRLAERAFPSGTGLRTRSSTGRLGIGVLRQDPRDIDRAEKRRRTPPAGGRRLGVRAKRAGCFRTSGPISGGNVSFQLTANIPGSSQAASRDPVELLNLHKKFPLLRNGLLADARLCYRSILNDHVWRTTN